MAQRRVSSSDYDSAGEEYSSQRSATRPILTRERRRSAPPCIRNSSRRASQGAVLDAAYRDPSRAISSNVAHYHNHGHNIPPRQVRSRRASEVAAGYETPVEEDRVRRVGHSRADQARASTPNVAHYRSHGYNTPPPQARSRRATEAAVGFSSGYETPEEGGRVRRVYRGTPHPSSRLTPGHAGHPSAAYHDSSPEVTPCRIHTPASQVRPRRSNGAYNERGRRVYRRGTPHPKARLTPRHAGYSPSVSDDEVPVDFPSPVPSIQRYPMPPVESDSEDPSSQEKRVSKQNRKSPQNLRAGVASQRAPKPRRLSFQSEDSDTPSSGYRRRSRSVGAVRNADLNDWLSNANQRFTPPSARGTSDVRLAYAGNTPQYPTGHNYQDTIVNPDPAQRTPRFDKRYADYAPHRSPVPTPEAKSPVRPRTPDVSRPSFDYQFLVRKSPKPSPIQCAPVALNFDDDEVSSSVSAANTGFTEDWGPDTAAIQKPQDGNRKKTPKQSAGAINERFNPHRQQPSRPSRYGPGISSLYRRTHSADGSQRSRKVGHPEGRAVKSTSQSSERRL